MLKTLCTSTIRFEILVFVRKFYEIYAIYIFTTYASFTTHTTFLEHFFFFVIFSQRGLKNKTSLFSFEVDMFIKQFLYDMKTMSIVVIKFSSKKQTKILKKCFTFSLRVRKN